MRWQPERVEGKEDCRDELIFLILPGEPPSGAGNNKTENKKYSIR